MGERSGGSQHGRADRSRAMNAKLSRALLLAPPAITVVIVALGLRIGASHEARAALVYGAPPAERREGVAWTVTLVREDLGVSEPVAGEPLRVDAVMPGGRGASWDGITNADGVVEAWLPLEGVEPGQKLEVSVTSKRAGTLFARGVATVPPYYAPVDSSEPSFLPSSRRTGAIALDALVIGRSLAPEFPSRVLVRATDRASGAPLGGVRITVEPEPGLEAAARTMRTCDNGWGALSLTARAHVVGATLHAEEIKPAGARGGDWFGALPVAGGALFVFLPEGLHASSASQLSVRSPTPRSVGYIEIDDARGRAYAQALELRPDETGMRSARADFPWHAPAGGFVVTSGEAHGAETLSGATLAFPFLAPLQLGDGSAPEMAPCEQWPLLARMTARGFPRPLVLDGFALLRVSAAQARRRGLALALSTVLLAAAVEALLLLRHARRARLELEHMRKALDHALSHEPHRNAGSDVPTPALLEGRAGTVALGLGIALLGFALLAALLLRSSS